MARGSCCRCFFVLLFLASVLLAWPGPSALLGAILFGRPGSGACVPEAELGLGPATALRELTEAEIGAFERDGAVVLRGLIDDVWVERLRALVTDVFAHPNLWDVMYSRFVANFYCAQKAILIHHTSQCGRQIAEAAPTTAIAAALLRSARLAVCEPTDALGNFRSTVWNGMDDCGTTGFHTDDAYMPVGRHDTSRAAVVRLWIPLAPFTGEHFRFAALNDSDAARAERAAAGVQSLYGTSYLRNEKLARSGVLDRPGQVVEGAGLAPGDVFAFAGTTPHIATALNCTGAGGGNCLRLILSFAGDNARFVGERKAALLPLGDNQTDGAPPQGVQFPTVFPDIHAAPWEWAPLRPSVRTLAASMWHAMGSGVGALAGSGWREQLRYLLRVTWFLAPYTNFWDVPDASGGSTQLSLTSHFGGALLSSLSLGQHEAHATSRKLPLTAALCAAGAWLLGSGRRAAGRASGKGRAKRSRFALLRLDWVAPSRALPHGLTGAVSLGSGLFLIGQAVCGAHATVGEPFALGIYCASTAANAVAGFVLAPRAPKDGQSTFRISAVFQCCLVYYAFRFSPACPAAVPALLDASVALATLGGIVAFVVAANARLPPAVGAAVLVGSFALALLAVYPVQLALGGEEWWACVQARYPQQGVGMSAYIYVPASWAFGAMLFGATLYTRKLLSDAAFGGGFSALVMLVLVGTVLAQEVHIPLVSTQKLWLPCPPPAAGSWSTWAEDAFDFSALAQAALRRFAPALAVGGGGV